MQQEFSHVKLTLTQIALAYS